MPIYTTLKGFNDIGNNSISETIESNLIMFMNWGLLDKGGFANVTIPTSGQYGGQKEILRLVQDTNYGNSPGRVWEGFRSNWVWESGLTTNQPIAISGVTVNGTFYPSSGIGAYSHFIDYPKGRVVFNTAISTTSVVKCAYSYKLINVLSSDKIPWFKEVQYNSQRIDSPHFSLLGSGDWFELGNTRLQLPAIVVEVPVNGTSSPYALGGGHWVQRDCLFHIFTEDEAMAMRLADIVQAQEDSGIYLINMDSVSSQRRFPLTAQGTIASGALTYPQMVEQFVYSSNACWFREVQIQRLNIINPSLFHVPVRFTAETVKA